MYIYIYKKECFRKMWSNEPRWQHHLPHDCLRWAGEKLPSKTQAPWSLVVECCCKQSLAVDWLAAFRAGAQMVLDTVKR